MPTITEISLEEGKKILAEYRLRKKKPAVSAHCSHGDGRLGRGILGWDFECDDGTILRAPPTLIPWVSHEISTWPFRYMTTKEPLILRIWNQRRPNEPEYTERVLPVGTRVKIVMASRMGDVGITDNLEADNGYHLRIMIDELEQKFENFSDKP
jgi:hypothetical protein